MTSEADIQAHVLMTDALSSAIQPLLRGHPDYVQSAVLADLMSLWLAGHFVPGNPAATLTARKELLDRWLATVWRLVPASEKELLAKMEARGHA